MSLSKQLWSTIALLLLLAFAGSFVVSAYTAKQYLEAQLYLKNVDNAESLALSLSHAGADPVSLELFVSAQFDTGHYRLIRLLGPRGEVLVERKSEVQDLGAPAWFVSLVPIHAEAGQASVSDGWRQLGRLTVESHSRYAYEALWSGVVHLLGWLVVAAVLSAVLGFWLIRRITRPLVQVVEQAEAIGARRFVSIPEPRTLEFRRVARAMNTLSGRVKEMLEAEADRLESLRREIQTDALTGLFTRAPFLEQVGTLLQRDDAGAAGALAIIRVAPLARVNGELGRERADRLLQAVAAAQQRVAAAQPEWLGGRLNGADFALLAAGEADALELAARLRRTLTEIDMEPYAGVEVHFPMGVAMYSHGESLGDLLARVDGALAQAEQVDSDSPVVAAAGRAQAPDLASWRELLEQAFADVAFRLARFPVKDAKGGLSHEECPMRMQVAGEWQPAGVVMPWLARLGWLPRFDAAALDLILTTLAGEDGPLCLNLSAEAIADAGFRSAMVQRLRASAALAARLWIDIPEAGAFREAAALRELCIALTPLGCRIGLEHAGRNFSRIGELHDLGLSYLKVGAALVHGIDDNPGNQAFLRGLAMVCHAIGLQAIAEGVANGDEADTLFTLGFNGVTGPGV